jgi:pre-rRNA-processing protein TSR1
MSFYAPAVFGTASSVLGFVGNQLTMWGSLQGCHPNKPVVVKRSTLTGYPFRVHQTKAVCRFMFFNPTDIDWFKPVELSTKKGLRGHIIESLGTHGYMKCRFNGQLTSDDIICLHLYKRVFPKFHSSAWQ